jgi:hypothetical protein
MINSSECYCSRLSTAVVFLVRPIVFRADINADTSFVAVISSSISHYHSLMPSITSSRLIAIQAQLRTLGALLRSLPKTLPSNVYSLIELHTSADDVNHDILDYLSDTPRTCTRSSSVTSSTSTATSSGKVKVTRVLPDLFHV